jgi:cell wall-associated NlpC family hydrolase
MSLLLVLLGCSPVYRYPGSTASVGRAHEVNTSGPWDEQAAEGAPDAERHAPARDSSGSSTTSRRKADPAAGEAVARAAVHYLGKSKLSASGERYRYDCSGLVDASYARGGVDVGQRNSEALYELAKQTRTHHRRLAPSPGDVVFFDNTYDRNDNGKLDDDLSHVAVVEHVDEDGTIHLIHKGGKGVVRIQMNLEHPDTSYSPDGKSWNSWLRASKKSDPKGTQYLAAQLYRGAASLWEVQELGMDGQASE